MRTRAERRKNNWNKANHKKHLAENIHCGKWYRHINQYSKGKIHCSCPLCSPKTNNRGRYGSAMNYKHSDQQKIDALDNQVKEFYFTGRMNEC
jgi:hypothetical protein